MKNTFTHIPGPITAARVMVGTGAAFKLDGMEFILIAKTEAQLDMILQTFGIPGCDHALASRR